MIVFSVAEVLKVPGIWMSAYVMDGGGAAQFAAEVMADGSCYQLDLNTMMRAHALAPDKWSRPYITFIGPFARAPVDPVATVVASNEKVAL